MAALTSGTKTIKDGANADLVIKTGNDSADGSSNTTAALIDSATGNLVSPATAGNQTSTNTKLDTIIANTAAASSSGLSTSALQTTGNTSLATIATNSGTQATAANQTSTNTKLDTVISGQQNTRAGRVVVTSTTITRPADTAAYTAGDLIANSATAGSVSVTNSVFTFAAASAANVPFIVRKLWLQKTGVGVVGASYFVHLFNVNPFATAPVRGDNGVYLGTLSTLAGYLGTMQGTMTQVSTGLAGGFLDPFTGDFIECTPVTGTTTLYGIIEIRGPLTPISAEVYSSTLYCAG